MATSKKQFLSKSQSTTSKPQTSDRIKKIQKAHSHIRDTIVIPKTSSTDADIADAFDFSNKVMEGYATLDIGHLQEIATLVKTIQTYANDSNKRRPLNILLHADPGSGKSHFVECLAKKLAGTRIKDVVFNMSSMTSIEDLATPIDRVRDLKVLDRLPLLFLDEFDSCHKNYARLLPLLWEGKVDIGGRLLQTGKMIVILAGSGKRVRELMLAAKKMKNKTSEKMKNKTSESDGKLIDLLSRINGGEFSIPGSHEISRNRDRRVDKVCLATALLQLRFGKSLIRVPWRLLHFIANTQFRHGARSITTMLDLLPFAGTNVTSLELTAIELPLNSVDEFTSSSLLYHIDASSPKAVVAKWKALSSATGMVTIAKKDTFLRRQITNFFNDPFFRAGSS